MATLINDENSIFLKIKLIDNDFTDIVKDRSDFENYIPFDFNLNIGNNVYSFPNQPTFSLHEIKSLLSNLKKIIIEKQNNRKIKKIDFYSSEAYFELSMYDPLEEGEVYLDLWLNLGSMTSGKIHGYEQGYRFIVKLNILEKFYEGLKEELNAIIHNCIGETSNNE